jgi:predicted permease
LLTEALVLSLSGAALGVLLAYRVVSFIVTLLPQFSFPHEAAIKINLPVLCFSVSLAILTAVLFGLSPALQLSRPEISQVMQASTKKVTGGMRGKRIHSTLIGGQIALTLLLLATAGAAIQGFLRLNQVSLGYNPHNVMSVGIPVHDNTYTTWEKRAAYFEQLKQRIAAMPQVTMAGISSNATPPSNGFEQTVEVMGTSTLELQHARFNMVSPEYFSVLQIPLLSGRIWDQAENSRGARVAVINQTMASQYFPNRNAIGQHVHLPNLKADVPIQLAIPGVEDWLEIVGVVADARDDGIGKPVKPGIYVPFTLYMTSYTQILVRTQGPPLSILHDVRGQIHSVDADQQASGNVRNLEEWIRDQREWAQQHLMALLFGAFAVLALVLSSVGLYSVVSYAVAQRTNEFGIRMALGAQRSDVLRIVFLSMVTSIGCGVLVGTVLSLSLNRLVTSWADGSSIHANVLFGVTALLLVVASLACWMPARRASSVDPMKALRYE